jgi:hypothetical protein
MSESRGRRRPLTAAERERYEDQRRQQLQDAHAQLTQALGTLANAGEWQAWLRFAAGFHRYSFNNTVWLMLQSRGTATAVAGYKAWQAKGRQVRAGEKASKFLAVMVRSPSAGGCSGARDPSARRCPRPTPTSPAASRASPSPVEDLDRERDRPHGRRHLPLH